MKTRKVVSILEKQLTYDSVIPLWIRLKIDLIVGSAKIMLMLQMT